LSRRLFICAAAGPANDITALLHALGPAGIKNAGARGIQQTLASGDNSTSGMKPAGKSVRSIHRQKEVNASVGEFERSGHDFSPAV
jgi:hypothetical protein